MQKFVGLRPKCYAFHCTGKVDKNVLEHTRPVEKKTAKGVRRKVKDDHLDFAHYLDTLRSFKSYVYKQNLIPSSAHTIHTTHTHKIGLTAFDTNRWLCEDTVHTHSHGHKDTVSDPMYLVNRSFIMECITDAGVFSRNDLPGTSLRPVGSESPYWDGDTSLVLRILLEMTSLGSSLSLDLILIVPILIGMDSHKTVFVIHLLI